MKTLKLILVLICVYSQTVAQNKVAPVVGPYPLARDELSPVFPVAFISDTLVAMIRDSVVPLINQQLRSVKGYEIFRPSVTVDIRQRKPGLSATQRINAPNERFVSLKYRVKYILHLNLVANRELVQEIEVQIKCKDWWRSENGVVGVKVIAPKPMLSDERLIEEIGNEIVTSLTLEYIDYTAWLNDQIKSRLQDKIERDIQISNRPIPCNCLNVEPDAINTSNRIYQNAMIKYKVKPLAINPQEFKGVIVKLESIKRLVAKDENGTVLYDPEEDLTLNFFANMETQSFAFSNFREGELRVFEENELVIMNPKDYSKLVYLAEIFNADRSISDNNFLAYGAGQNYGQGVKTLVVFKKFTERIRRPDGTLSKPVTRYAKAYEIQFKVVSFARRPPAALRN